jgi:hypothetical protein|tara:strand:- start:22 stop:261 length:240 start_codon:yes stop_codon:yes gene_type:complete
MKINTKYKIGDEVYVFNENKLQKTEIRGIYANVFTIYPTTEPQMKTEINYDLKLIEGSVEEDLVYNSVQEAKDNVVVEG